MRWPWVSRTLLDEKDKQIAKLEVRNRELEQSVRRQHDLVYKANFGVQVYDTLTEVRPEPEKELTPDEKLERELRDEEQERRNRITWTKKQRPSQLAAVIAHEAQNEHVRAAHAAHPAQKVFETARAQVNGHSK